MKLIILFTLLVSVKVFAIKFYQSTAGSIVEIDETKFKACNKIIYRNSAKGELPLSHQKNLVKATLKGELVNDLQSLTTKLKADDGVCSYAENNEVIK